MPACGARRGGWASALTIGLDSYLLKFRADGRQCAVVTDSGVQFHAFEQPSAHREFSEDLGPRLRRAAFSPDGRRLAASADNRLGVWDLAGGGPGALAEEGFDASCFFTPDGREFLGQIQEPYQAAISLFYLEDYSYKEIADILDIPLGTVRSRISRGMALLQQSILRSTGTISLQAMPAPDTTKPRSRKIRKQTGAHGIGHDGQAASG